MKLKTLKDINWLEDDCPHHKNIIKSFKSELKAEAVKWVKEDIEEHKNMFKDVLNGKQLNSPRMDLIKKWMRRLNITSEDLK